NRGGGQGGGGGRGPGGGGFQGGGNPTGEWLKEAGIDEARTQKIMAEMQTQIEAVRATVQMPQQQQGGGGILGGGGNFGPPQNMQQQAAMQEMRGKMQAAQDKVLKANLTDEEYAKVAKARAEMQTQKPVVVYAVNDKGDLERKRITIGLSDGTSAQVIRGA